MANLILAIDQGTTGSSAAFFHAETLDMIAQQKIEFPQIYPTPGWVEHNPVDIWSSVVQAVESSWKIVLQKNPTARKNEIIAIGVTNQRETCLAWNKNSGETAGNALVWQDRRTADRCLELRNSSSQETIRQKTGLVCDPYFSGTKMEWLLRNQSKTSQWAKEGRLCLGTIDSYLVYQLSGKNRSRPIQRMHQGQCFTISAPALGTKNSWGSSGSANKCSPEFSQAAEISDRRRIWVFYPMEFPSLAFSATNNLHSSGKAA